MSEPVNERESQELARLAATWQDGIERVAEIMRQTSATASRAMENLAAFSACVEGDEDEEPEHFA